MKLILALYFTIACLSDPWIDGMSSNGDSNQNIENLTPHSHGESSESHNHTHAKTVKDIPNKLAKSNHNGPCSKECSDECPQHRCHLGHCGFPVSLLTLDLPEKINNLYVNYNALIASPHIRGLKRPPKRTLS